MKNIRKDVRNKVKLVFTILILIMIILIYTNKTHLNDFFIGWSVSILTGIILTGIAQSFVQGFSGNKLEKLFLNVKIRGKRYSISLFLIATLAVRYILFPLLGI